MEGPLVNRYKQYKAGTAKLVNWLANTARGCHDVTGIIPSLKAHAKKRSKKAGTAQQDTNVTLSTSQLLKLAEIVADASITIPKDIINTTKAVIAGRQICADWYDSLADSTNTTASQQKDGHQHFIDLLKQIQTLLEASYRTQVEAKQPKEARQRQSEQLDTSNSKEALANMFSYLQVEEPTDDSLGPAPPPKSADKPVEFKLEDTTDEKFFAIWCLLQDLRDLRQEIRSTWQQYKDGEITLNAAAMVTSAAHSLAKYAEHEFINQHPDLDRFVSILTYVKLQFSPRDGEIWICSSEDDSATPRDRFQQEEIEELFSPVAFYILKAFWIATWTKAGVFGPEFEDSESVSLRLHPFSQMLQSLLVDLDFDMKHKVRLILVDDFWAELIDLLQHPLDTPKISLVHACQVSMDVVDILGTNSDTRFSQCQSKLETDQDAIYSFLNQWDLKTSCTCKTSLVTQALQHKKMLKDLSKDPYHEARIAKGMLDETDRKSGPPFRMYRSLPALPGSVINLSAVQTHEFGIRLCNYGHLVLCVAYLYKAALRAGAISKTWPDMEFIIHTHSKKRPLVLEPETEATSMARCLGLALGLKINDFRKGNRPSLPTTRIIEDYGRKLTTEWPLRKALEELDPSKDLSDMAFVKAAFSSLQSLQKDGCKDDCIQEVCDQFGKTGKLTPSQLLLGFKEVFVEHEMDLKFDYINFFFLCSSFLHTVRQSLHCCLDALEEEQNADFAYARELVYVILWDALDKSSPPSNCKHSIFWNTGTIMEKYIESFGSKYSDLARKQTSGYEQAQDSETEVSPPEEAAKGAPRWKGEDH